MSVVSIQVTCDRFTRNFCLLFKLLCLLDIKCVVTLFVNVYFLSEVSLLFMLFSLFQICLQVGCVDVTLEAFRDWLPNYCYQENYGANFIEYLFYQVNITF